MKKLMFFAISMAIMMMSCSGNATKTSSIENDTIVEDTTVVDSVVCNL